MMADATVVISKETGDWLFPKRVYIIIASVNMNLSI